MSDLLEQPSQTEQKIFEAARHVFHRKGLEGARMQEIADNANIHKSMLHYYYRSKEALFQKVYQLSIMKVMPEIVNLLNEEVSLELKIRKFVVKYIETIQANPDIPLFILHELNKDPNRFKQFIMGQVGKKVEPFLEELRQAAKEGRVVDMPPEQILVNILSLTVFPFIGRPVIQMILGYEGKDFDQFIEERRLLLPDYVINSISK
ncbi:MAG: TetR/AcrR family transcriptional regulator [Cyclonatronaceae bacterium]